MFFIVFSPRPLQNQFHHQMASVDQKEEQAQLAIQEEVMLAQLSKLQHASKELRVIEGDTTPVGEDTERVPGLLDELAEVIQRGELNQVEKAKKIEEIHMHIEMRHMELMRRKMEEEERKATTAAAAGPVGSEAESAEAAAA